MADFFKRVFSKKNKKKKDPDLPEEITTPNTPHTDSPFNNNNNNEGPQDKATKDDFESLEVLGKGTFAHVVLARHKTSGKYYAMKVVNKQGLLDHKRVQDVFTERNVLTRANHPFLLKLHYTFQSEHKLFFVMDYMAGGDLDKYINSQPSKVLDPVTTRLYACEVFMAIAYLHENGVIYRDLKPENILIDREGHCALADFGLSKDFYPDGHNNNNVVLNEQMMRCHSFVGSPFYVAPEVLQKKEYTTHVDLWSFGILLYRLGCGRLPFSGANVKEVFENIIYSDLRFPSSVSISPELRDLISKLLVKDTNKRIRAHEVRAHPYWEGLDFNDVYKRKIHPPFWKDIPKVEDIMAMKASQANNNNNNNNNNQSNNAIPLTKEKSKQPAPFVNTPINTVRLQDKEQQMFVGFSCTTDSVLQN